MHLPASCFDSSLSQEWTSSRKTKKEICELIKNSVHKKLLTAWLVVLGKGFPFQKASELFSPSYCDVEKRIFISLGKFEKFRKDLI